MAADLSDLTGIRVVIVEDEALLVEELADRLARFGASVVASAATGAAALSEIERHAPDLVMLDVKIKGPMDGIVVAERLAGAIPIVFLTAHADDVTLRRAKRLNPGGYLVKPFDDNALRVALELALHRHSVLRRLAEREAALETARLQLIEAEKHEAIGRIAGGVAQDVNNLMTVVTGFSEMLLAEIEPEQQRRRLEKIRRAGQRSANLAHQLLGFSQRLTLSPEAVDLAALVREADVAIREVAGAKIRVEYALCDKGCVAVVDRAQLTSILLSLVDNAARAMADGGVLCVAVDTAHPHDVARDGEAVFNPLLTGYARVSVSDTGIGMTPEECERVFEPYFKPKPFGRSTGISLAAAYGIIRQSGGHIRIQSKPGLGTTVDVFLAQ